MDRKLKTLAAFMLIALMLAATMAGCGSKTVEKDGAATATPAESTTVASLEPTEKPILEISWFGPSNGLGNGTVIKDGNKVQKKLEELFRIKLKTVEVDPWSGEPVNLMYASGQIPDFAMATFPELRKAVEQGACREITQDMVRRNMPKYSEALDKYAKTAWQRISYGGKMYAICGLDFQSAMPMVELIRKDYLTAVGISKTPETIDEYEEAARAMTFNDPDKNDKNDTFGIGHFNEWGPIAFRWVQVFGAFGIPTPNNIFAKDGKVNYVCIMPEYKEALKKLQAWYKEGLIDPEFVTLRQAQFDPKWYEGKIGIYAGQSSFWAGGYLDGLKAINPEAEMDLIINLKGPGGSFCPQIINDYSAGHYYFGIDTSDEKVERIMQMIEAVQFDPELYRFVRWGEEGVDYEMSPEGVPTSKLQTEDEMLNAGIGSWIGVYGGHYGIQFNLDEHRPYYVRPQDKVFFDKAMTQKVYLPNWYDSTPNDAYVTASAELDKMRDTFYYEAITWKFDIDSAWDAYVESWLNTGGQAALDEAQKLYDAAKAANGGQEQYFEAR